VEGGSFECFGFKMVDDSSDIDWRVMTGSAVVDYWRIIVGFAATGILIAAFYLYVTPPQYLIRTVMTGADQSSSMSSLAGVGRALGVNVPGGGSEDYFAEFLETMRSEDVARDLADKGWLPVIYSRAWDAGCKCWKQPGVLSTAMDAIYDAIGRGHLSHPTYYDLYRFLDRSFQALPVSSGGNSTSMIEIDFYYKDPKIGLDLLTAAIADADSVIKRRATERAERAQKYLQDELPKTPLTEERQTLFSMLGTQEAIILSAASRQSFASRVVVAPSATPTPVKPGIPSTILIGAILGALVGFVLCFLLAVQNSRDRRAGQPFHLADRRFFAIFRVGAPARK
jgi:hypothetical protein